MILTLLVFAAFVGLTALDDRLGPKRAWYPSAAGLANIYFLGAALLVAWFRQPEYSLGLFLPALGLILSLAVILRASLGVSVLALGAGRPGAWGWAERVSAAAAATLVSAAAILYSTYLTLTGALTGPVARWVGWGTYLKGTTAAVILGGLALSVTLLLRWHGSAAADQSSAAGHAPPVGGAPELPWPRLPDGSPYPAGRSGQPDFSAGNFLAAQMAARPACPSQPGGEL